MAERRSLAGGSINALLFYAGLEIAHNMFGDNCSSPQTTELRVGGKEGGGAAESTLMKWVHIASSKALVLTGAVGLISGNWFSFFGAGVAVLDMQATYWYAKACGRKLKGGYGSSTVNGNTGDVAQAGGSPLFTRP